MTIMNVAKEKLGIIQRVSFTQPSVFEGLRCILIAH
jgi:hypothetical protein